VLPRNSGLVVHLAVILGQKLQALCVHTRVFGVWEYVEISAIHM